jgi:hypothetical protein
MLVVQIFHPLLKKACSSNGKQCPRHMHRCCILRGPPRSPYKPRPHNSDHCAEVKDGRDDHPQQPNPACMFQDNEPITHGGSLLCWSLRCMHDSSWPLRLQASNTDATYTQKDVAHNVTPQAAIIGLDGCNKCTCRLPLPTTALQTKPLVMHGGLWGRCLDGDIPRGRTAYPQCCCGPPLPMPT